MRHLSYEICCELRDAGFPQECEYLWHRYATLKDQDGIVVEDKSTVTLSFRREVGDYICGNPNLEELIEAVPYFHSIHSCRQAGSMNYYFIATGFTDAKRGKVEVSPDYCETPAEAVAKLWLALKKEESDDDKT